jgi:hypothetical protein
VYPWLADVGFMNSSGVLVSAVVDNTMTLAVSDGATLCLVGSSATTAAAAAGNSSSPRHRTFTNASRVGFEVDGATVECALVPELSSPDRLCCLAPPVATLCGFANTTDCLSRGACPSACARGG